MLQFRKIATSLGWLIIRSVILTAACVFAGMAFNAARSDGIPVVAPRPYEIYVPCPETLTEAQSVDASEATQNVLYVDARPTEQFQRAHIKGATNLPYDVLADPSPQDLDRLKKSGR